MGWFGPQSGTCGCCSPSSICWSCPSPTSLTVAVSGSGCCIDFNGTFVFSEPVTSEDCTEFWSVEKPYYMHKATTPIVSGGCSYCLLSQDANFVGAESPYVCKIESYETSSPSCKEVWFMLDEISITAFMRDASSVPTITITVKHLYTQVTFETNGSGGCQERARREWQVTDTYESTIDCNDATTDIAFVSRVMLDDNGSTINSPTSITWGWSNEKTYSLCSTATVTLTK